MLDLGLLAIPTVRGSAVMQTAVMIAMVGVMFGSTQLYQYAWGWSAFKAGLANLPFVAGMLLVGPFVDRMVIRLGHRKTSMVGISLVLVSLLLWIYAVSPRVPVVRRRNAHHDDGHANHYDHGCGGPPGRTPETHTSIGSAMNDTAQELGNAVGVAIVGTVMATVVGKTLPHGPGTPQRSTDSCTPSRSRSGFLRSGARDVRDRYPHPDRFQGDGRTLTPGPVPRPPEGPARVGWGREQEEQEPQGRRV
jgi:hypothetical protein